MLGLVHSNSRVLVSELVDCKPDKSLDFFLILLSFVLCDTSKPTTQRVLYCMTWVS